MTKTKNDQNVVKLSKSNMAVGDQVTITYKGWLAENGAENVYAHLGYGEAWEELSDVKMKKEKNGEFKAKLKLKTAGELNMCFKDDWNNWDNNNSSNYSFEVNMESTEPATQKAKSAVASKGKSSKK